MLIQQIVRTDPEKVLINVKNVDASSLTTGYGVALAIGADTVVASTDGIQALLLGTSSATDAMGFIGVAYKDIAANGYGLVQAWGYCNSVALSFQANKTIGILAGASLLQKSAAAGLFTSALAPEAVSTYLGKYIVNCVTTNISGGVPYTQAFLRCL